MAFNTAISGLNAATTELNTIGNNVANASTTGFKQSRAEFSDVYPVSNFGVGSNTVGAGVKVDAVSQQFTQGNINFTNNALDLAISGDGFFRLSDNGAIIYSRAGAFGLDANGYISNNSNYRLTGYQADAAGNITGALGELQVSLADLAPSATTAGDVGVNLNASALLPLAPTPTSSLTLGGGTVLNNTGGPYNTPVFSLYDTAGTVIAGANLQFTSTGGNNWNVDLIGAGGTATTAAIITGTTATATITWDPDGPGAQPGVPINIDVSALTSAGAGAFSTTATPVGGAAQGAFNPSNPSSYNNATSVTLYDSLGSTHLATTYFRKTGANTWDTILYVDGNPATTGSTVPLTFNGNGSLATVNGAALPTSSAYTYTTVNGSLPLSFTLDFAQSTQFGSGFGVNFLTQDGYTTGRLSGLDIDGVGVLSARYTNGQSLAQGQLVLSNFTNPQGLKPNGDTSWSETSISGTPLTGAPGTASLGLVQSGALEGSNVNLTEQLVAMITAQRNFQANAQVISTEDAITQTIINMR